MRTRVLQLVLACAVALGCASVSAASAAAPAWPAQSPGARSDVVVVLAPLLSWDDISAEKTPALWGLIDRGAVGNLNARTADEGWPTFAGGVLSLSASRWARGPVGGPIDAASLDRARAANATAPASPTLGALGSALRAAGVRTIAIGASDTSTSTPQGRFRPAELLATDESGTVDVSYPDVLARPVPVPFGLSGPSDAYGIHTDPKALNAAITRALARPADAASGTVAPRFVVIDVGDISRAHDATDSPDEYERRHEAAVQLLDDTVAFTLSRIDPSGLLMVVPAATDKQWYKAPAFGPLFLYGHGFTGEVRSPSTRRDGLAVNLDIAPTVLAAVRVPVPAEMLGKPLSYQADGAPIADRLAALSTLDASVGVIDQLRDAWLIRWFCYVAIVAIALTVAASLLPFAWLRVIGEALLAVTLSAFPAGWLMFIGRPHPTDIRSASLSFLIACGIVTAGYYGVRAAFPRSRSAAPLFLVSLTSLVIAADQWLGHPIESGMFSYSVAAGWRFYGIGNEGSAILVAASIAAVALGADALHESPRGADALRRFGLPIVGAVVLVTAAAPFAGANAGVAVWGVVAYGIAWAAMNGMRLSVRTLGVTLLAVVVVVMAFSAIDLARSTSNESHLARFARGILHGDVGATTELVRRKLANNLAYLPQTTYTGLAIAMAAALAVLRFARGNALRRALAETPTYAGALLGIVVGALAAWATEDSGIVMPALMLFAGAAPALLLAVRAPWEVRTPARHRVRHTD